MIISNDLIKSKLRWLQVFIILGGLIVLPLGVTNARDSVTEETAQETMLELEELQKLPELFLGEIYKAIKEYDIRLKELKWFGNSLDISGTAPSNEDVAHFMKNLGNSPLFQTPDLKRLTRRNTGDQTVSDFYLEIILDSYPDISLLEIPQEVLEKIRIEDKEMPELLTQITKIMVDAKVDIPRFRPMDTIKRDGYSEFPINITIKGKYENIIKAFAAMRQMDRFVTFRNIKVRFDESNSDVKEAHIQLVVLRNTR